MASGDAVVEILHDMPTATLFASLGVVLGTSTPVERIPVWQFDPATVEYMDFLCRMNEKYAGGGITLTFYWISAQTTNAVVWSAAFRRIEDDAEDLDTTAQTYDYNNAGAATSASAIGELSVDTLTFTNGADMDSVAAGELFILRVRRVATDGGDTMTGDASLLAVVGKET